jgi:toxin ParE1/3/4
VRLRFLSEASRDVGEIEEYIAAHNPDAARAVARRILEHIRRLRTFPFLGRPGRKPGTRILVVPRLPYLAVYEITGDEIVILGVMHTARNWQDSPRFR